MTDEEKREREKDFEIRMKLIDTLKNHINKLEYLIGERYKLSNPAILFNNKIIEIYHVYEKSDKNTIDSKLYSLIYNHLLINVLASIDILDELEDYIYSTFSQKKSKIKKNGFEIALKIDEYVRHYNLFCDIIFEFDIEKNIEEALQTEVIRSSQIEKTGKNTDFSLNKEEYIEKYNDELKEIGINKKLSTKLTNKQGY
ncbi:MAG: hypothetical protein IIZ40_02595 [Bacilli bacterium]|nr:hypothetical protein [Bacilli bacterium]